MNVPRTGVERYARLLLGVIEICLFVSPLRNYTACLSVMNYSLLNRIIRWYLQCRSFQAGNTHLLLFLKNT
jgi:hypothetical protein